MDFYLDPIWVMCKAEVLDLVWVLTESFAPLEVWKPFLPSELVLVCWVYFKVEDFTLSLWY